MSVIRSDWVRGSWHSLCTGYAAIGWAGYARVRLGRVVHICDFTPPLSPLLTRPLAQRPMIILSKVSTPHAFTVQSIDTSRFHCPKFSHSTPQAYNLSTPHAFTVQSFDTSRFHCPKYRHLTLSLYNPSTPHALMPPSPSLNTLKRLNFSSFLFFPFISIQIIHAPVQSIFPQ
jgi:hypothetical protein